MSDERPWAPILDAAIRQVDDEAGTPSPAEAAASWQAVAAQLGTRDEPRVLRERGRENSWSGGLWRGHLLSRQPLRREKDTARWQTPVYLLFSLAVVLMVLIQGYLRGPHTSLPGRTYRTGAGQYATVTLMDGSRAQLGPATTLHITTDPKAHRIDARIRGEMLLTVLRRPMTAFQVYTDNAVLRVLGTRFLVRRYPGDRVTQVVVADGRISVSGARRNAHVLTAGTLGTVDDSGHVVVAPGIAVDDYTVWTTGRLVFRDTPLRDVVAEVGRAYDVEIRIADSTRAERHFDWTVPLAQRSLADILESLADVLDAHPVRAGRIITFMPGRPASRRAPDLPLPSTSEHQYGK